MTESKPIKVYVPVDVRFDENGRMRHARTLEHAQKSLMFLAVEPYIIAVNRRINLGISPSFILFLVHS